MSPFFSSPDVQPLVDRLKSLPKDATRDQGYSLIPVHAWTHPLADVAAYVLFFERCSVRVGNGTTALTLSFIRSSKTLPGRPSFFRRLAALASSHPPSLLLVLWPMYVSGRSDSV
jgi:hypothetical protein